MIRLLENATGRMGLIRRARGFSNEINPERGFFDVMVDRYGLSLDIFEGSLDLIPREGPLICVANHPYGILDGLMMCHILSRCRRDFRIMAHSVFDRAPEIAAHLLPISFDANAAALQLNLQTRQNARHYLGSGGAVGIFPGGTVSTGARPFSRPLDPGWRSFTARMIARSDAQVVPIYFDGQTSRIFQLASHLHSTLRVGLLMSEFRARVDTPVRVAIGKPIGRDQLGPLAADSKSMMDFLRKATYDLAPEPVGASELGFEFEEHHRA